MSCNKPLGEEPPCGIKEKRTKEIKGKKRVEAEGRKRDAKTTWGICIGSKDVWYYVFLFFILFVLTAYYDNTQVCWCIYAETKWFF